MSDYESEIVQEFLIEGSEMLDSLERSFVALEANPGDTKQLRSVFRTMHTIKGTCGFLGFGNLEGLAHRGENLLSMLRDGVMQLDRELIDALLATVDLIRDFIDCIAETHSDSGVETGDLIARLIALVELYDPNSTPPEETVSGDNTSNDASNDGANDASNETTDEPLNEPEIFERFDVPTFVPEPFGEDDVPFAEDVIAEDVIAEDAIAEDASDEPVLVSRVGDLLVENDDASRVDVEIAAAEQDLGDPRQIGQILKDQGAASPDAVEEALDKQRASTTKSDVTIRVDVALLDDLMNLVGELVLARNEILQNVSRLDDVDLAASSQRLNIITSDLQERVMKTRMQPIAGLWSKLPRVVRDLSHQCGKRIRLEMEGKETELDKSLLEAIKDPIIHIVRNTVDHGIEPAEVREANGKDPEGVLRLVANHEGGQVNIEITDDGGGIDPTKIRAKAVQNGLIQTEEADSMSDADAVQLIFMPGFSTAAKVTNVSGRGVGMDVVRTNIEEIGGSVEVRTQPGEGTAFKMKIPLTLAIVPALVVAVKGHRYAIPQTGLVELLTLGSTEGRCIEFIHGAPVLRNRDRLLPIVDLRKILHPGSEDRWHGDVVILTVDDCTFGVLVDDIVETQEIVVKPLGNVVADVGLFSGATILGDGKVALILDVLGVAHDTNVLSLSGENGVHHSDGDESDLGGTSDISTLLLLRVGDQQVGIALEDVARLEEFRGDQVERTGSRSVIQYRDTIMPLVDLAEELGYGSCDTDGRVSVVVYTHKGRDVGLMIGQVIDIIEANTTDPSGCIVAQGHVTEVIRPSDLPSVRTYKLPAESPVDPSSSGVAATSLLGVS